MRIVDVVSRSNRAWWWLFGLLTVLPAIALALLGLWAVRAEPIERGRFNGFELQTLRLLGTEPILGRWFDSDEPLTGDTAATIVISYAFWQRHFGGDPDVIGQELPGWQRDWGAVVIGVMPPGFWTVPESAGADAWYAFDNSVRDPTMRKVLLGRLKPGVNLEEAQAELDTIFRRLGRGDSAAAEGWGIQVRPWQDMWVEDHTGTLYILLGAVGFVLLIACVNVANLQLTRAAAREPEIVTRVALGAGRWRLIRQLVAENVLLVVLGDGLGFLVALVGLRLFGRSNHFGRGHKAFRTRSAKSFRLKAPIVSEIALVWTEVSLSRSGRFRLEVDLAVDVPE